MITQNNQSHRIQSIHPIESLSILGRCVSGLRSHQSRLTLPRIIVFLQRNLRRFASRRQLIDVPDRWLEVVIGQTCCSENWKPSETWKIDGKKTNHTTQLNQTNVQTKQFEQKSRQIYRSFKSINFNRIPLTVMSNSPAQCTCSCLSWTQCSPLPSRLKPLTEISIDPISLSSSSETRNTHKTIQTKF